MKGLIFVVILAFSLSCSGQTGVTGFEINVRNTNEFDGFEVFDSAIKYPRVVMTGENHTYVKFNSKMELKMLRYLNQKVGTRNFVIELGAARAQYINRYINEADTMAERYLRATTSPRYIDLFKRMKKFNLSLPDSLKIRVWGIDVERFNDLPLIRLSELLPDKDVPKSLRVGVDAVHGAAGYLVENGLHEYEKAKEGNVSYGGWESAPFYVNKTIYEFIRNFDSLNVDFKSWLGSKYHSVNEAVNWLRDYKQWKDYENTTYQYIWREENIYKNISGLLNEFPKERFYGQFGRCHVSYAEQNGDCGWYGYHSVINKLKSRYFKSADSVLTIGIFYARNGDRNYYSDREDDKEIQKEIGKLLDKGNKKSVTVFNLKSDPAEFPKLGNKFSFAIVNDATVIDDDTAESELVKSIISGRNFNDNFSYMGYGFTHTTINTAKLRQHSLDKGYPASVFPFQLHEIVLGVQGKTGHEIRVAMNPKREIQDNDSLTMKYSSRQYHYRFSYSVIRQKKIQLGLGLNLAYSSEYIRIKNKKNNFLEPRGDRNFVHSAFVAGPAAHLMYNLGQYFYIQMQVIKAYDLSGGQWKFQGSAQPYGEAGKVSAGFGGMYYNGSIGFKFPLDELY